MSGKVRIQSRQFAILVVMYSLGSAILIVPSGLMASAKQDGWMAAVLGVAAGLLLIPLYSALGRRFPGQTPIVYSQAILGPWLGRLFGFIFLTFCFLLGSLVLRNMGDFITTIMMPETPIQAIHILFLIIVVMGVRLGIEVIARTAEIFIPWIVLLILILIMLISPEIHLDRLGPFGEFGIKPIIKGSLTILSIPYLELAVLLMVFPKVAPLRNAGKAWLIGALIGGVILIVIPMLCILVLGWDFTARHTFPSYTLAKKIHIGEFLQRIEVLMAVIWFVTIFFKLVLTFYASAIGLAELFGLKTYKPLLYPLALIMLVLSLVVFPTIVYFRVFAAQSWFPYVLTMGFVLPALLLIVAAIRKLGPKTSGTGAGAGPGQEPEQG